MALVSRRFHALCFSPQLLEAIEARVDYTDDDCESDEWMDAQCMQRLLSLHGFLSSEHAQHVRSMDLVVSWWEEAALISCLTVCGSAGRRMEELRLHIINRLTSMEWLPRLSHLRRLRLAASDLWLPASMGALQALQSADLECMGWDSAIQWGPGPLPSSLTHLGITFDEATRMPWQVGPPCCTGACTGACGQLSN